MFLINGIVIKFVGIVVINKIFNNLFGIVCKSWKVGQKYYFGKIFNGVVNGFVGLLIVVGFKIVKLIIYVNVLKIVIGNMYNKLLG